MSRSLAAPSSTATGPPANVAAPGAAKTLSLKGAPPLSSTALFITNLRLLDFDLQDDWPDITVHTFTTKDAQQNQKKRIQCVEWALFRLFEIWDMEETREKLSPFFPPLEPLQSLNLRGALYRCLNDLKKNGVLGRETVLRKTMLDECKGDKLMEILVVFSNAVLRKRTRERKTERKARRKHRPVAHQYALAESLSNDQQTSLLPLAIAHKAALTNVLRRKEEMKERYREFGRLLELKSQEAVERMEKCGDVLEKMEQSEKEPVDGAEIKRILHDNWLGNPEWLEVMVQGDQAGAEESLFQMQFEDIWSRVKHGQPIEEEQHVQQHSLLQDLEARVKGQEERLSRWKAFHERLRQDQESLPPDESESKAPKERNSTVAFKFDAHQELRLGRATAHVPADDEYKDNISELSQGYGHILANMREDLEAASKVKSARPPPRLAHKPKASSIPLKPSGHRSTFESRPRTRTQPVEPPPPEPEKASQPSFQRPISPDWFSPLKTQVPAVSLHHAEDEPEDRVLSPVPPPSSHSDNRSIINQYLSSDPGPAPPSSHSNQSIFDSYLYDHGGPEPEPAPLHQTSPVAEDTALTPKAAPSSPSPPSSPIDAEDQLAEQILTAVDAASPSPVKRQHERQHHHDEWVARPSLSERTRMTMEGNSPAPDPRSVTSAPRVSEEQAAKDAATAALIERTRQTMLLMEQAGPAPQMQQQKTRNRANSKRGSVSSGSSSKPNGATGRRASLFPANPWETRKVSPLFEEWAEHATQQEEAERNGWGGGGGGRAATPKDELFEAGVDEQSVFKSRPKIAASPMMAPEEDVPGDVMSDLGGDVEESFVGLVGEVEDDDGSVEMDSSPLRGKGR